MKIACGDLNLAATLESGQVFGFEKDGPAYAGVLDGHAVRLCHRNGYLEVQNGASPLFADRVRHYFDLDFDLSPVYEHLRGIHVRATRRLPAGQAGGARTHWFDPMKGLRLLRQDPWEALACFIISSNNNIKRITGIYRRLTAHFAAKRGDSVPRFPSAREIALSSELVLRELGLGYRARFLWATAMFVSNNPYYLSSLREAAYEDARQRVLAFPGIGPKVADCVLLYGFHKLEAFPVDVWIARAVTNIYFRGRRVSEDRIRRFGMKRWGAEAGYIQQYLFHASRMSVIK